MVEELSCCCWISLCNIFVCAVVQFCFSWRVPEIIAESADSVRDNVLCFVGLKGCVKVRNKWRNAHSWTWCSNACKRKCGVAFFLSLWECFRISGHLRIASHTTFFQMSVMDERSSPRSSFMSLLTPKKPLSPASFPLSTFIVHSEVPTKCTDPVAYRILGMALLPVRSHSSIFGLVVSQSARQGEITAVVNQ